jgi:hypothetical protein
LIFEILIDFNPPLVKIFPGLRFLFRCLFQHQIDGWYLKKEVEVIRGHQTVSVRYGIGADVSDIPGQEVLIVTVFVKDVHSRNGSIIDMIGRALFKFLPIVERHSF